MIDQIKTIHLRLKDLLLLFTLITCTHHTASLTHRIHTPCHVLTVLLESLQTIVGIVVIQEQRLELV